jgi:hypothetical protein
VSQLTSKQSICLHDELKTSVELIKVGLGEIQKISGSNQFYQLAFFLLSIGIERFLKAMICVHHLATHNTPPEFKDMKKLSHDIEKILDYIKLEIIENSSGLNGPAMKDDFDYINNDKFIIKMIGLISTFGQYARYHNLDTVTSSPDPPPDIEEKWKRFEFDIIDFDPDIGELSINLTPEYYAKLSKFIVSRFERFMRAISRHFTLSNMGDTGREYSIHLHDFLLLRDDEIGTQNYVQ